MVQLSVAMPSELQHWVEAQIAGGRYLDAGEYLRDLVRRDRDQDALIDADEATEMRALIAEGDASGVLDEDARDVLRRVIAGVAATHG